MLVEKFRSFNMLEISETLMFITKFLETLMLGEMSEILVCI